MNGKDMVAVMMAINKLEGQSFTARDEEVTPPNLGQSPPSGSFCCFSSFLFLPDLQQISQLRQPAAESVPPQLPAQL